MKTQFYKRIKWWQVLIIMLITLLATAALMSCDSTKGHDFEGKDLPEPALVHDKTIYSTGELSVGSKITFTTSFPARWSYKRKWTVWDGRGTYIFYGDEIVYKPKHKGTLIVLATGFDENGMNPLHSNLWKRNISEMY